MNNFDKFFDQKIKLYEAGLPSTQNNPMVPKTNPQQGQQTTQPASTAQTQTPQTPQTQQTQQKPATQTFNPQEFETMVKSIVTYANNPEAQKILQKYMQTQQPSA